MPDPRPRRPFAVWLLLLFLGVFAAEIADGAAAPLRYVAYGDSETYILLEYFSIAIHAAMLAATLGIFIGVFRRRQWGRWLGIVVIFVPLFASFSIIPNKYNPIIGLGPYLPLLLLLWWAYMFGFADSSRLYFGDRWMRDCSV